MDHKLPRILQKPKECFLYHRSISCRSRCETKGMRPMRSAEATMSVFANRVKNGRAWVERGIHAFLNFMVGLKDDLPITTLFGPIHRNDKQTNVPKPKFYQEWLKNVVREATTGNIPWYKRPKWKTTL